MRSSPESLEEATRGTQTDGCGRVVREMDDSLVPAIATVVGHQAGLMLQQKSRSLSRLQVAGNRQMLSPRISPSSPRYSPRSQCNRNDTTRAHVSTLDSLLSAVVRSLHGHEDCTSYGMHGDEDDRALSSCAPSTAVASDEPNSEKLSSAGGGSPGGSIEDPAFVSRNTIQENMNVAAASIARVVQQLSDDADPVQPSVALELASSWVMKTIHERPRTGPSPMRNDASNARVASAIQTVREDEVDVRHLGRNDSEPLPSRFSEEFRRNVPVRAQRLARFGSEERVVRVQSTREHDATCGHAQGEGEGARNSGAAANRVAGGQLLVSRGLNAAGENFMQDETYSAVDGAKSSRPRQPDGRHPSTDDENSMEDRPMDVAKGSDKPKLAKAQQVADAELLVAVCGVPPRQGSLREPSRGSDGNLYSQGSTGRGLSPGTELSHGVATLQDGHGPRTQSVLPQTNGPVVAMQQGRQAPSHSGVRKKRYRKPVPSAHCHICCRPSRSVPVAVCSNILDGTCRKVICSLCVTEYRLGDWNVVTAEGSTWQCTHCADGCSTVSRAQCFVYSKTNLKRKLAGAKRRQNAALAAATAGQASNAVHPQPDTDPQTLQPSGPRTVTPAAGPGSVTGTYNRYGLESSLRTSQSRPSVSMEKVTAAGAEAFENPSMQRGLRRHHENGEETQTGKSAAGDVHVPSKGATATRTNPKTAFQQDIHMNASRASELERNDFSFDRPPVGTA